MKKLKYIAIQLCTTILLTGCSLTHDDVTYHAKKTVLEIEIDGKPELAWRESPFAEITNICRGLKNVAGPSDFSGSFKILWSEKYLYLLFHIKDDIKFDVRKLKHPLDRPLAYLLDCVEIFIEKENAGAYFGFIFGQGLGTPDPTVKFAQTDVPDGYYMEIGIPWHLIDVVPQESKKIRFETSIVDNDNRVESEVYVTRRSVISWSPYDNANAWEDTSVFGNIILIK